MFWFTVRPGEDKHLTEALKGQPGVLRADVTFGPYDVIIEVEAQDLSRFGKIVYSTIRPQTGRDRHADLPRGGVRLRLRLRLRLRESQVEIFVKAVSPSDSARIRRAHHTLAEKPVQSPSGMIRQGAESIE